MSNRLVSPLVVLLCNHDGSLWLSQFREDTPTPGIFESLGLKEKGHPLTD